MSAPLRLAVGADEIADGLVDALAGGPPVAPLPSDPAERARALEVLRPGEPETTPDAAAVVTTSGSTGAPKAVVLSRAAIRAAVAAATERLGGEGDWALALLPHHVAGLMVLARAIVTGRRWSGVGSDLRELRAPIATASGRRYLSVVPTQLVRAVTDPALTLALTRFDAVLVGGGPAPAGVLERARTSGIRCVTTYGMSETCGGCVYDGVPLRGVTVRLDAADIVLGGATLFSSYRLQPGLTAAALVGGELRTADRGRWVDGRLQVLGRRDDVVVTGGHNVDLAAVEAVLVRLATEVCVVGLPDPEWGTAVVAVVVGGTGDADHLRRSVAAALGPYAAPRRVLRVDHLPRLGSGKVDRVAVTGLAARLAQTPTGVPG